ncbi:MAG: preprotein translocase subunit SecG [Candidatus Omnitrophica bacterium]|nr:preprotein translocase subunit SecG [Candidatus Omnitrophota bacterium]
MMGLVIFLHSLACVLIITVVLIQAGRSGGLAAGFSQMESLFGAKTNESLVKATTIFATIFLVTSLTLTIFSSRKERSLLAGSVKRAQTQKPLSAKSSGSAVQVPLSPSKAVTAEKPLVPVEQEQGSVPVETNGKVAVPAKQPTK